DPDAPDGEWFDQLELDLDNLRAGLATAIETSNGEVALRLAIALSHFFMTSAIPEGRRWFEQALALPGEPLGIRSEALRVAGLLETYAGDWHASVGLLKQAVNLKRELGDDPDAAYLLVDIGDALSAQGAVEQARAAYEEAVEFWADHPDSDGLADALHG